MNRSRSATLVLIAAIAAAGCGLISKSVPITSATVSGDGLEIRFEVAACSDDLSIEMQEDAESVSIWVSARSGEDQECATPGSVELEIPLGDRIVIDGHDFTRVEVTPSG